jgi:hypothetical protein
MQRPLSYLVIAGVTIIGIVASAVAAGAASGSVSITKSRGKICMASNGLPDHATGRFPNPGNPHRMRAQFIEVCVPENPVRTARATELRGATGFALNGVLIRPGTADYYDPSSPRGFSRDPASGWKLDGKGAGSLLGLDQNNAHVDHRGLYHYHAKPTGLLKGRTSTLVGFAADGFEIHYVGSRARSGYTLKPGDRQRRPRRPSRRHLRAGLAVHRRNRDARSVQRRKARRPVCLLRHRQLPILSPLRLGRGQSRFRQALIPTEAAGLSARFLRQFCPPASPDNICLQLIVIKDPA